MKNLNFCFLNDCFINDLMTEKGVLKSSLYIRLSDFFSTVYSEVIKFFIKFIHLKCDYHTFRNLLLSDFECFKE
jgi:hypothetical protein